MQVLNDATRIDITEMNYIWILKDQIIEVSNSSIGPNSLTFHPYI